GQRRQRRGVEPGNVGHVVVIDKLGQITKFDAVFGSWVLVLVVEIFAVFREPDRGEALVIEGGMVSAAEITVAPENELRRKLSKVVGGSHLQDVARQLA